MEEKLNESANIIGQPRQFREYAYTVFVPGESWSGHVGGQVKGGGQPGKLTGGVLEAYSEIEARDIIRQRHGENAKINTLEPRIIMVRSG